MPPKTSQLDKILGRVEDLDSTNLAVLVQKLARERALLETVFNVIHEGILVIDKSGLIEYANQSAKQIIGIKNEECLNLWKQIPSLAQTLKFTLGELDLHADIISREIELNYPEHRIVRLYIAPIGDIANSDHIESKFAIILSDITQDKIQTEETIQNEKVQSIMMLAAGVAHELGNPLNGINIHLQVIKRQLEQLGELEDHPAINKIKRSLEITNNEVERLDSIIKHFLEAVRPQRPNLVDTNIIECLGETLNVLSHEMSGLKIEAEIRVESDIPTIAADKNQIKQVFFNIIKNAMEAMDCGGNLKITAAADDDKLLLCFEDTGVGISEESISQVFDPYFSTKATGHGLGMMIVQRIMSSHGGSIDIDSKEDQGTIVRLKFPRIDKRTPLLEDSHP